MKEIDTDISVTWPSCCYTDNIRRNGLEEYSELKKDLYVHFDIKTNSTLSKQVADVHKKRIQNQLVQIIESNSLASIAIGGEKKMLSERSLLLSGYSNKNTIDTVEANCEKSNSPPPALAGVQSPIQGAGLSITPTTTAAAAAAYLYLEKVKNERMSPRVTAAQLDSLKDAIMESSAAAAVAAAIVNNNNSNSINNNNNVASGISSNCNNNSSSINNNNNNLVSRQVQNQIVNNCNTSDELQSHSLTQSSDSSPHQQQQQHHHQLQLQKQIHHHNPHLLHHHQQQQQSLHMNSNHVKKERLSPGTNGDLQTTLSRSRSTTPSSFRDTSPQHSVHSSPSETLVPMHNLSTNLLNSIHQAAACGRHGNMTVSSPSITSASSGLPADFSTRNYSDFMRSLAAKYNNTNPNDNLKRSSLFEATSSNTSNQKKTSTGTQKTLYAPSPSTPLNKEVTITTTSSLPPPPPLTSGSISPNDSSLKLTQQQNKLAAAVANAAVSPYMTSFLSSLPFSQGIFPPLIDMSSTQALITLARAAKENEIHNILSISQQHSKRATASSSPSPSPSLNMALQQAAQFISPALIYSAQLQKQQLHQQHQQQQQHASRQSSPRLTNITNSTTSSSTTSTKNRNLGEKNNVSPLDLSSQPPASKRFKAESTSSQSSTDGLIHTTITRRASSSTATTSPSPPPFNEKSLNASAITAPTPASTVSAAVVGSSTKTEATTTAFTPIKVASSTSATSSIAPAVTVRQCQAQSEELNSWTVDDVCAFVGSIDICAEYVKHFRDQCIDGSGLPLLTEDHLVNSLGMKLGPALKLRSVLAKKLGGPCPCVACVAQVQQVLALQTGNMSAVTVANVATTSDSGKNVKTIDSINVSGGSCNSHLPKNPLSTDSSSNSSVNRNEESTSTTSSTNNPTSNLCNSDANNTSNTPRSNSNSNTNVGNFSSPTASVVPTAQQQHHRLHQQHSPSENICSSDNNNPANNRHDSADSSS